MPEDTFDMNAMLRANYPASEREVDWVQIDSLIFQEVPFGKNYKTARIVSFVCDKSGKSVGADQVVNRLVFLETQGKLITFGDMSRWGFSEVSRVDS